MLTLNNISFTYPDADESILEHVSFDVAPGACAIIQGDNGIGKTTLLKCMLGMLTPTQGTISIDDFCIPQNIDDVIAHGYIGCVFTNPDIHVVNEVVFEEVAFTLENRMYATDAIQRMVDAVLDELCIAHLRNSVYETLSRAERKMVTLAAALVGKPRYLLLDDPTCWLDPDGITTFMRALRRVYNAHGSQSIVCISHEPECFINEWLDVKPQWYRLDDKTLKKV